MVRVALRTFGIVFLVAASFMLAACQGGHPRGMFSGKVMGETEAEIIDTYGPTASVDRKNPDSPVILYTAKTFDPDNSNRPDPETLIFLAKGKIVASDVDFRG